MYKNRSVFVIITVVVFFLFSFIKNDTEPKTKEKFVIVLDAGHGGHDPGNLGNGYLEKDIALKVVLKVGEILEKNSDIKVLYTRKDDSFIDLFVRGQIANTANADLFVSVHCNAHGSDAYGAETFVLSLNGNTKNMEVAKNENSVIYLEDNYEEKYSDYDLNSPEFVIGSTIMQEEYLEQSIELAKLVQNNFVKKLKRKDRKVKQAAFIVLHQTFMPSVLVELGFLSNRNEGAYLNSDKGQREMGIAIANAVLTYKDGIDANLIEFDAPPTETIQDSPITNAPIEDNPIAAEEKETKEEIKTDPAPSINTEPQVAEEVVEKKPDVVKEKKLETPSETKADEIVFKVQLLASSKNIPLKPENFNGLDQISSEPIKNMFRYLYGNAENYAAAERLKAQADTKGYTTSYIVAYRNGERIALKEALK